MKVFALIGLTALLVGCNSPVTPTASAETLVDPVPGPTGAVGPQGPTGAQGPIGPQGPQGLAAPKFVLKDANGVVLGTYMGDGMAYNEDENVFAKYDCGSGWSSTCVMAPIPAGYYGAGCTGHPWVIPTFGNQAFGSNGQAWIADMSQPPLTNLGLIRSGIPGDCSSLAPNPNTAFYPGVLYTGVLPYSVQGPLKVVKQ